MGYYTNFALTTVFVDALDVMPDDIDFKATFVSITGYSLDNEWSLNMVKWYNHETDMRRLSARYPQWVWQLDAEGEEQGDIWRKYFHDGRMQRANSEVIIKHDAYNETKLDAKPNLLLANES
jgi:hypothetical protein